MAKKIVYLSLFTFLGILISFLVHAGIEIPIIYLLDANFEKYGLGLTWDDWFSFHYWGSAILFTLGAIAGFWQGIYWWKIIYVEKRLHNS